MDKIKALLKDKEVVMYLIFGVLTTIVNYIVYFGCTSIFRLYWLAATVISWVAAVIFAYITNRIWVFESKTSGWTGVGKEIILFVSCRILSLGFDMGTMFICMDLMHMGDFIWIGIPVGEIIARTIVQVIVVVSNYIFSKWIIFRNKPNR